MTIIDEGLFKSILVSIPLSLSQNVAETWADLPLSLSSPLPLSPSPPLPLFPFPPLLLSPSPPPPLSLSLSFFLFLGFPSS